MCIEPVRLLDGGRACVYSLHSCVGTRSLAEWHHIGNGGRSDWLSVFSSDTDNDDVTHAVLLLLFFQLK